MITEFLVTVVWPHGGDPLSPFGAGGKFVAETAVYFPCHRFREAKSISFHKCLFWGMWLWTPPCSIKARRSLQGENLTSQEIHKDKLGLSLVCLQKNITQYSRNVSLLPFLISYNLWKLLTFLSLWKTPNLEEYIVGWAKKKRTNQVTSRYFWRNACLFWNPCVYTTPILSLILTFFTKYYGAYLWLSKNLVYLDNQTPKQDK